MIPTRLFLKWRQKRDLRFVEQRSLTHLFFNDLFAQASEPTTRAYAVMEHQATNCEELPAAGVLTLHNVTVAVGGHPADDRRWTAMKHLPTCDAHCAVNGDDITFMWQA